MLSAPCGLVTAGSRSLGYDGTCKAICGQRDASSPAPPGLTLTSLANPLQARARRAQFGFARIALRTASAWLPRAQFGSARMALRAAAARLPCAQFGFARMVLRAAAARVMTAWIVLMLPMVQCGLHRCTRRCYSRHSGVARLAVDAHASMLLTTPRCAAQLGVDTRVTAARAVGGAAQLAVNACVAATHVACNAARLPGRCACRCRPRCRRRNMGCSGARVAVARAADGYSELAVGAGRRSCPRCRWCSMACAQCTCRRCSRCWRCSVACGSVQLPLICARVAGAHDADVARRGGVNGLGCMLPSAHLAAAQSRLRPCGVPAYVHSRRIS